MSLPSLPSASLFFFENAKIWVGRTTLNREKKGDGLILTEAHFPPALALSFPWCSINGGVLWKLRHCGTGQLFHTAFRQIFSLELDLRYSPAKPVECSFSNVFAGAASVKILAFFRPFTGFVRTLEFVP